MPTPKTVYQLKVTLIDSKPPIWRRILVPDSVTLSQLHTILQIVMGWTDSHLHMFTINEQIYGDPEDDETGEIGAKNERRYRLNQLVSGEGFKFRYEYDFGDSWEHALLVEKILPAEKGVRYPVCVAGKRACPPEDVGGVWGYGDFLEALADPRHPEHDEYLEWVGGKFDPEQFDLDGVNERLRHFERRGATAPEEYPPSESETRIFEKIIAWTQGLTKEQFDRLDSLPVRRDMVTFLNYLIENRTVGTQSTGNLPLKAVRAICEKFVKPPALEATIGDYHYQVRSETDIWPLLYIHILADAAQLVSGGPARTWQVTTDGQDYFKLSGPIQLIHLLFTWWHRVDWTCAFPFEGFSRGLPPGLNVVTLACLLELPTGEASSYEAFAGRVIQKSGLVWPIADQVSARNILHSAIGRMVVQPLVDFGVLECEYGVKTIGGHGFSDLISVRLTPVGKGMLELLK